MATSKDEGGLDVGNSSEKNKAFTCLVVMEVSNGNKFIVA